jgi:serine/threonine-protein kinase HipA
MSTHALALWLHGVRVGTLAATGQDCRFEVAASWQADPDRVVLGQKFENERRANLWRSLRSDRLPAWFSNLLPEGVLASRIRRSLGSDVHEMDVLERVGQDLPGALIATPSEATEPPTQLEEALTSPQPDAPLRFSLAGVQLKFSAFRSAARGLTVPASGLGGDWIVKLPGDDVPDLAENEFWTMEWAHRAGIPVPDRLLVRIDEIEGLPSDARPSSELAFAVRRFDRLDGKRVHQEDFAQVRGVFPEDKYGGASYEELVDFVAATCGHDDAVDFVRRIVFVILSGNIDAHLKNWSLVYPDGRTPRLSPAYDQVFVPAFHGRIELDGKLALPLAKELLPGRVGLEHFERVDAWLAKRRRSMEPLEVRSIAQEAVATVLQAWRTLRDEVPDSFRTSVETHLTESRLTK